MKKLLAIVGPTGTGKTDLGIRLAKEFDGEIVSADSRQIFTGMDIGTGKIPPRGSVEKGKGKWLVEGIPIYFYDILSPSESFSVADFQQLAYEKIKEIHAKSKLPLLVGGTGLYIRAVLEGLKIPKAAPDKKLRAKLSKKTNDWLFKELEKVDPQMAEQIDKNNSRRMIRALEIFYQTGEKFSSLRIRFKTDFDALKIGLTSSREYLYEKVDKRVDKWFEEGFLEEVKNLLSRGFKKDLPSMSSLGYRQASMYLKGEISLEEAKQRIKWDHHAYIRRQLTWFRKEANINWLDIKEDFYGDIKPLIDNWLDRASPEL